MKEEFPRARKCALALLPMNEELGTQLRIAHYGDPSLQVRDGVSGSATFPVFAPHRSGSRRGRLLPLHEHHDAGRVRGAPRRGRRRPPPRHRRLKEPPGPEMGAGVLVDLPPPLPRPLLGRDRLERRHHRPQQGVKECLRGLPG